MVACSMLIDEFGMCIVLCRASMCILNQQVPFVKSSIGHSAGLLSFDLLYRLQCDVTSFLALNCDRLDR